MTMPSAAPSIASTQKGRGPLDPVADMLNAIGWVNFRIRGGWKMFFGAIAVIPVFLGAFIAFSVQASTAAAASSVLRGWLPVLMIFQSAFLVLLGNYFINHAVRRDVLNKMIESHRLMPLSSRQAIFGYLTGGALPAVGLGIGVFILGLMVAAGSSGVGSGPPGWVLANGVLALFALLMWTVTVLGSLTSKNVFGIGALFGFIALIGLGNGLSIYFPALLILISPLSSGTIFGLATSTYEFSLPLALGALFQILTAALFFSAAARKFRRPHAPAFLLWQALGLLGMWVLSSLFGILLWEVIRPRYYYSSQAHLTSYQVIGSAVVAMLLALLPVGSAAWASSVPHLFPLPDAESKVRPSASPTLACILATAIIAPIITLADDWHHALPQFAASLVVVLATLLTCSFLLRILYRAAPNGFLLIFIWIILAWTLPLIADAARYNLEHQWSEPVMTGISAASPIGAMIELWDEQQRALRAQGSNAAISTSGGIAFQAMLPVLVGIIFFATRRKRLPPSANPTATPAG